MKHIVALSGGKDSTALALRLSEVEPRDYEYICTPTGNEPPEMFEHWRKVGDLLGKPILPISGGSLSGLIDLQNALPNWRQRWCTRMLKIEPYARWLTGNLPCTSYVGLRADEPEREGGDYMDIPGVTQRFPMREWGWGESDVWAYLNSRGVAIPKRTDCLVCFWQRLIEWWEFWKQHPDTWLHWESVEERIGHTFRSESRDTWPASMKGLRERFELGDVPRDTRKKNQMQCRVCRM